MKNKKSFLAVFVLCALGFFGCTKDYSILVSSQDLRFGLDEETQTITVKANCKWSITKNEDADWYTISPMSGSANDSIVTVTVQAYPDGDFRESFFVIASPGGHIRRTVFVNQSKLDFDGMINKVFGLTYLEHWNTDYFGQIIEETYYKYPYNPFDTTTGCLMFFMENGIGVQRDRFKDHAVYHEFNYEYQPENNNLHIEFHLVNDSLEIYDAEVLCASDSLYRVFHQYKPNFWERADHRKVGTITPEEKALLRQKVSKRHGGKGIYQID